MDDQLEIAADDTRREADEEPEIIKSPGERRIYKSAKSKPQLGKIYKISQAKPDFSGTELNRLVALEAKIAYLEEQLTTITLEVLFPNEQTRKVAHDCLVTGRTFMADISTLQAIQQGVIVRVPVVVDNKTVYAYGEVTEKNIITFNAAIDQKQISNVDPNLPLADRLLAVLTEDIKGRIMNEIAPVLQDTITNIVKQEIAKNRPS